MKYSMLSVAAFVASSLASPAYFRGEPEKPGPITVDNKLNTDVRLEIIPIQGHEFEAYDAYVDIKGGQAYTIEDLPPSADLKLRLLTPIPGQGPVDVIYRSLHPGPDSPFRYWVNRGNPHFVFPGVVDVQPKPQTAQCYRLTSYPNRLLPPPPFCDAGTKLLITLCQQGHPDCPPGRNAEYDEAEWL